jgi:hypothetical protein
MQVLEGGVFDFLASKPPIGKYALVLEVSL